MYSNALAVVTCHNTHIRLYDLRNGVAKPEVELKGPNTAYLQEIAIAPALGVAVLRGRDVQLYKLDLGGKA